MGSVFHLCIVKCVVFTLMLCIQVAMSRFDTDKYIPYEKMSENLKIVRDR